jgi:hypothetical protein
MAWPARRASAPPMWRWSASAAWALGRPRRWRAAAWAQLTLIDLDHVAESNINRQIHALDTTVGQAKVLAMARAHCADQPRLPGPRASKNSWCLPTGPHAARRGGRGHRRLRPGQGQNRHGGLGAATTRPFMWLSARPAASGWRTGWMWTTWRAPRTTRCWPSALPAAQAPMAPRGRARPWACLRLQPRGGGAAGSVVRRGGRWFSLNCHGYGSVVSVTATFGQCAAGWVLDRLAGSGSGAKKDAIMHAEEKVGDKGSLEQRWSQVRITSYQTSGPDINLFGMTESSGTLAQLVEQRTFNPLRSDGRGVCLENGRRVFRHVDTAPGHDVIAAGPYLEETWCHVWWTAACPN